MEDQREEHVAEVQESDHPRQLRRIVANIKKIWPKNLRKYLTGVFNAVQTTDYYYRDYRNGESPFMGIVDEIDRLNLVVISESHARTNPSIVGRQILAEHSHLVPFKYQKGHVNLVHCLSYGEAWLAGIDDKSAKTGTPSFWKLQMVLGGTDEEITADNFDRIFSPLLKSGTNPEERVSLKCSIMDQMEERKIKLIDMTPSYIYLASGSVKKPSKKKNGGSYTDRKDALQEKDKKEIILHSWEHYIKPYLTTWRPHNVIILGKNLTRFIREENIADFMRSIGGNYQGTLPHPSGHYGKSERIAHMNNIRRIANDSQRP
jgi:hypothetical protein